MEKTGIQLKRILVKTNPWAGTNCQREDCMVCHTREQTGEGRGKACHKRNILYETWCGTCQERDREKAEREERDPEVIPLYKYIGESSRSSFARGKNHMDDMRLLSPGSHMLKHFLDKHQEEELSKMKFHMRILAYKRTAYERQVHESVKIHKPEAITY